MSSLLIKILTITGIVPVIALSQTAQDSLSVVNKNNDTLTVKDSIFSDSSLKTTILSTDTSATIEKSKYFSVDKEDTIDAAVISKKLSSVRTSFTTKLSKSRAQGYGGGIMINPMITAIKMEPVHELATHDYSLRKYNFPDLNDHYQPILMMGATAYGGVGKGIRIGFGGWRGSYSFNSEPKNDSVLVLDIHQSFGGFLVEKAIVHKNMNYLLGGMLGFGSIDATRSFTNDGWIKLNESDDEDEQATAKYTGLNLHGGFTVSVLPWMHLGLDVNGTFVFSVNGFNIAGCNSFGSAIPGIRLRITLGNIG